MNITIDKEFKTLIPPMTEEEFSDLEANCLENGILDSLKVWNGILVDGHNRYEIAQKHGLEFKTDELEFSGRDDVKLWIIKNQLGRRNLDKWTRFDLVKSLEKIEAKKAKERQGTRTDLNIVEFFPQGKTRDAMGEKVGVSGKTFDKMKAIDKSDNEEVKRKVRNKEISIDKAYRDVKGLPPKKKTQPQTEVRDVEITVTNEDVMKNPIQVDDKEVKFIETEESHEDVEDVAEDVSSTFSNLILDELKSNISRLTGMDKFYRTDVVSEIQKLDVPASEKEELKQQISGCLKWLAHIETGLIGW